MTVPTKYSLSTDGQIYRDLDGNIDAELLREVQEADQSNVERLVQTIVQLAARTQGDFQVSRSTSTRRQVGAKVQKLASRIHDFVQVFSGVVEVIKGADAQAGPIAYGSFVLLLTIAKNKQMHEDFISDTLETFRCWLSRLKMISSAEKWDETVQKHIFEIYIKIIDFAQQSIRYYCSSSARRFFRAISRPPQLDAKKYADEIKESIADLMQGLLVLQHARISEISSTIQANICQAEHHENRIAEVRKLFNVPSDLSAEDMLQHSKGMFSGMFARGKSKTGTVRRGPPLEQVNLETVSQRPAYDEWVNSESSSLLLLEGDNYDLYDERRLCWLSPVTIEFYEHVKKIEGLHVIFHCIDRAQRPDSGAILMLRSIIIQLLEQDIQLCIKRFGDICGACKDPPSEPDELIDFMFQILETSLQKIPLGQTIYMVLDGVEHLGFEVSQDFFGSLLQILDSQDLRVTVKVFAVCRLGYWPTKSRSNNSSRKLEEALGLGGHVDLMSRVFYLDWKQGTLKAPTTSM
ncbi:hypothetical protein P168DRAFT_307609 [Aspergillus campestris IBT 28561]|uniref:Fungal STAND N-terminal Goodbye domain-containing protein n=1 Tax=Aspergillus campestris (strain IBT 28561) TaxID=1392248 RepID=A0A2I1CRP3_ASPC2|nr:uncharacterized protein P168DRAFT_307609 [Aspergillus campestris IBT 28561]PKY00287.1 hypothetical protein P168DRAFT_307609 [Aspergillus campestris IBT 28561]